MKIKLLIFMFILGITGPVMAQLNAVPYSDSVIAPQHRPGQGFSLYKSKEASLTFALFGTVRYLNNSGFNNSYTDYFGRSFAIDGRNDLQLQKVTLYFSGFLFDPRFRYMLYVWTANTNLGLGAQVVVAGNLQYRINKYMDLGVGVNGVPTNRMMLGQWPAWHRQDARPMADEFFRGSFTTGIWLNGNLGGGFAYKTMLGNNLSQLGIDAGQLDDGFNTWGTSLYHTTNNYGLNEGYGDFEKHASLATSFGASYTSSIETPQSQPGSEAPENSQIRLTDGTGIFGFSAFNDSSQVMQAHYQMSAVHGGIKYKGFALDAEVFIRLINDFKWKDNKTPVNKLIDKGISVQTSYMVLDKKLQAYAVASTVSGDYGDPYEFNVGLNWFPFQNKSLRINPEYIYTHKSPVGYISYPTLVGATGSAYMINLELYY